MSPESFNLRGVSCMGAGNRTQTQWRGSENREVLSHFASGTPGGGFLGDSQPACGQQSQMNSQAGLLQAVRESKRSSFPLKSTLGKTKSFPHVSLSWTDDSQSLKLEESWVWSKRALSPKAVEGTTEAMKPTYVRKFCAISSTFSRRPCGLRGKDVSGDALWPPYYSLVCSISRYHSEQRQDEEGGKGKPK